LKKILVIQTASIGDVILATSLLENLHNSFPDAEIDILIRAGHEPLFSMHPFLHRLLVWNKKEEKYKSLLRLLFTIRKRKYDRVINVQRFASSGFLTAFSNAKFKSGFKKNPFSWFFNRRCNHHISKDGVLHEIERNHQLIKDVVSDTPLKPHLYPSPSDYSFVSRYKTVRYITISPASLWFTKQFPAEKIVEFLTKCDANLRVYLLGGKQDIALCDKILRKAKNQNVVNLSGRLSLLQSAALMENSAMNFVNDSAPMHLASSRNAQVSAIFCSTVPEFGFGPLSDNSTIIECDEKLECRPCGLHGKKICPLSHFDCGNKINIQKLLDRI